MYAPKAHSAKTFDADALTLSTVPDLATPPLVSVPEESLHHGTWTTKAMLCRLLYILKSMRTASAILGYLPLTSERAGARTGNAIWSLARLGQAMKDVMPCVGSEVDVRYPGERIGTVRVPPCKGRNAGQDLSMPPCAKSALAYHYETVSSVLEDDRTSD